MKLRLGALLARRLHVYGTALALYVVLKTTETLLNKFRVRPVRKAVVYSVVHTWCARRLLGLAKARGGFWTKFCQYIAARSDVFPPEYPDVLVGVLDSCPADPAPVVREVVEGELGGRAIEDVFVDFDAGKPIASASIAQVHKATLRESGRKVVLKIQHPSVRAFLLQDLADLARILAYLGAMQPDYDLRPMMEAWIQMVPKECDFRHEARNMIRVRKLFSDTPSELATIARVPEPIMELSTDLLLVMEYVDGSKMSDIVGNVEDVDKERLVEEITKAFALQLHVSGFFNGDQHSGNFLVDRSIPGAIPVLLDFGITVYLDEETRLGFSKLIVAAADNDSYALLQAFEDMRIVLNRADPVASMELIKFMFRTTVPRDQTVEECERFKQRMLRHRENSKTRTVTKIQKDESVYKRPLIDAYPGHIIFFMRSLALLRGLATTLGVRHAYLPTLRKYAARALIQACPHQDRAISVVYQRPEAEWNLMPWSLGYWHGRHVQLKLDRCLALLAEHDFLVGCQVAVYYQDELIVDTAAGTMGKYNSRPVKHNSLFNVFNASEAIVGVLFGQMMDEHKIKTSDRIVDYWKEFEVKDKETTTVQHLLTHSTGIHAAAVQDMSLVRVHNDFDGIVDELVHATAIEKPGSRQVHPFYDLNFGYLAAGFIKQITGESYSRRLERLTELLGIEDECYCGNLPQEMCADKPTNRVVTLSNSIIGDLQAFQQQNNTQNNGDTFGAMYDGDDSQDKRKEAIENLISHKAFGGTAGGIDRKALENLPQFFMEPSFFNHPLMRDACVPAVNAHVSARALARICAALSNDGRVQGKRVLRKGRVREMMDSAALDDSVAYGGGMRVYDTVKDGRVVPKSAIGATGLGGAVAFAVPEERFAMAITVNKLNFVSAAAGAVVITVCNTLGVGMPREYAEMAELAEKTRARMSAGREGEVNVFESMKEALAQHMSREATRQTGAAANTSR